jgi:hypothetical protein
MKPVLTALLSAALLASAAVPVQSQSLLGGIIGRSGDDALVTVGSGKAGGSGLVNLGVGGDDLVDLNVGDGSTASATIGRGRSGGLGADVNLLNGTATAGLGVGGDNLIDLDVGIGNGGSGTGGTGGTGSGGNGGNGGIGGAGGVIAGSGGGDGGFPICNGFSNAELQRLLQSTRIQGWDRASGVNVQRVPLCPEQREWLAAQLPASSLGQQLRAAVSSDALISASLSRTSYGADRVLAVQRNGSQLTVYVF